MPESVLMPAPVNATRCSEPAVHRAIVSTCCWRRCSFVTLFAAKKLVVVKTAYQTA
jgi:hypothetical protein